MNNYCFYKDFKIYDIYIYIYIYIHIVIVDIYIIYIIVVIYVIVDMAIEKDNVERSSQKS